MNELQNLRASLLDKVNYDVNEARKCYSFIIGEESDSRKVQQAANINTQGYADGVYICYNDGHHELFNEKNLKKDVRGIGLVMGEHSLCISLDEQEYRTLTNKEDKSGEDIYYISDWDEARLDFDGRSDTLHIKSIGTDIKLKDDEYIPSLGELYLIYLYKYKINKALSYVGGITINDNWYWSSTANSASSAWLLSLSDGFQGGGTKSQYRRRVRVVSAFTPSTL